MARSRGVAVVSATLISLPLIIVWGLVGAVISAMLIAAFTAVALAVRLHALGYSPLRFRWASPAVKPLLALGLASTASAVAHGASDVVSRGITLTNVGAKANGLIQAPVSVTGLLQGVLLGSVGAMSVAVVARASGSAEVRHELHRMLDFVIPFAALGFAVLGATAPLILRVLFSEAFAGAEGLFLPILLYQYTVVLYWIIGSPLLAAGRAGLWLSLELIGAGVKVALTWWLVPILGMEGLPISLVLFALLHLALNILVVDRALGITVAPSRYAGFALGAATIAACFWLPSLGPLGVAATATVIGATVAICVHTFRSTTQESEKGVT